MTIEDLLVSLTSFILRYHDSKLANKILPPEPDADLLHEKYREHALKTLEQANYHEYLEGLINEVKQNSNERIPLLSYILNEIIVLKSIADRKTPFSPEELAHYKKQMAQMLIDLKQLVVTDKKAQYSMKYSSILEEGKSAPEKIIPVEGTSSYSFLLIFSLCTSGSLLTDAVLKRFNITTNSSENYLNHIAEKLCNACQSALLAPKPPLKANDQKAEIEELQHNVKRQELILQEQAGSIQLLAEKLKVVSGEAEDWKLKHEQAQKRIGELEATIASKRPLALGFTYGTMFGLNNPKYAQLTRISQRLKINPAESMPQAPEMAL